MAKSKPKAKAAGKNKRSAKPVSRSFLPKDRLEAFSDGVLAIVITILVLELQVPDVEPGGSLLEALGEEWRSYLGYLISFMVVGGAWVAHTETTRMLSRSTPLLLRLTLVWLLAVSVIPFSTALMTRYLGDAQDSTAVAIYGINLFLASALLTGIIRYLAAQPELAADDLADDHLRSVVRERKVLVAFQGVSVLIALVLPHVAVLLYLVIAVLFLVMPLLTAWRHRQA